MNQIRIIANKLSSKKKYVIDKKFEEKFSKILSFIKDVKNLRKVLKKYGDIDFSSFFDPKADEQDLGEPISKLLGIKNKSVGASVYKILKNNKGVGEFLLVDQDDEIEGLAVREGLLKEADKNAWKKHSKFIWKRI